MIRMRELLWCVSIFSLIGVAVGIHWTFGPADGSTVYACVGDTLLLNWTYQLSVGDDVHDIQWIYKGQSEEMVALYAHGNFVPLPAYGHRVEYAANGGLRVGHVTGGDSGNYTVEVTGAGSTGVQFIEKRTVQVIVADALMTTDRQLHVTQSSTAVDDGHGWSVELRCGQFTFHQPPPYDVQWTTPSGEVVPSSSFKEGHFSLFVSSPVTGGKYTCSVASRTPLSCTRSDVDASATLDSTAARLSILEAALLDTRSVLAFTKAELTSVRATLDITLAELQQTRNELNATKSQLTARLEADWSNLHRENVQLQAEVAQLNSTVSHLEDASKASRPSVSFHARYLNAYNEHITAGSRFIVRDVITNIGHAYDRPSGEFSAPYNGTYFFTATTGPFHSDDRAGIKLYHSGSNDEAALASAFDGNATDETTTLQSVLHLGVGQRVWLSAWFTANYWSDATTFSGFLISVDERQNF